MKVWLWVVILLFQLNGLIAQSISGKIMDQHTGEPLIGATVQLNEFDFGVVSDSLGYFSLPLSTSGVYSIRVSFVGYQSFFDAEVWVKNRSTAFRSIALVPSVNDLEAITITDRKELSTPGRLVITEEQINRFASTYYDPARMATTIPDVAVTNDQNNRISVRGISPNYNTWRLEGAEILNPNHLSNAGTFSDQPTSTGGGVNMLSAQMMSNSTFLYGAMDAGYGNTVGGLFDMQMKTGNPETVQYVGQASFIGFDFAADGPMTASSKATFALNYRYSFTGLLTGFGVDFGGEKIGFQDLSFSMNFPVGKRTNLKVFGVGGLNFNRFEGSGPGKAKVEKDLLNIDFEGKMGLLGVALNSWIKGIQIKNTVVGSTLSNSREEASLVNESGNIRQGISYLISDHFSATKTIGSVYLEGGFMTNAYFFTNKYFDHYVYQGFGLEVRNQTQFNRVLISPYIQGKVPLSDRVSFQLGLVNTGMNTLGKNVDARASLNAITAKGNEWVFSVGQYRQFYNSDNYYFAEERKEPEIEKDFIRSMRYTLDLNRRFSSFIIQGSLYHYQFPSINVSSYDRTASSGRTGVSILAEKYFEKHFYFRLGSSTYHPTLSGAQSYTSKLISNFSGSAGKVWELNSTNKLTINLRSLYTTDIKLDQSLYFRSDFRVQWTCVKPRTTRNLSLDIQNVTNHKNPFYSYFDFVQFQLVQQKQLGLIPIVTYRVDF